MVISFNPHTSYITIMLSGSRSERFCAYDKPIVNTSKATNSLSATVPNFNANLLPQSNSLDNWTNHHAANPHYASKIERSIITPPKAPIFVSNFVSEHSNNIIQKTMTEREEEKTCHISDSGHDVENYEQASEQNSPPHPQENFPDHENRPSTVCIYNYIDNKLRFD
jgi:hypothetical protein